MSKKVVILVILGALLLIGIVSLFATTPPPVKPETTDQYTTAQAYLAKNVENYARCYNSINYGSSMVSDIRFSYLRFNSSDQEKQRLTQIETTFNEKTKQHCNVVVSEYEKNFNEYTVAGETITNSESSWRSKLFGSTTLPSTKYDPSAYEPSLVRIRAGNPLDTFIFTRADVEQYFESQL